MGEREWKGGVGEGRNAAGRDEQGGGISCGW